MLSRSRVVAFADSFHDENAAVVRNNKTTFSSSMIAPTPSTKKRVAFGDISNRKQHSQQSKSVSKSVSRSVSRSVSKSLNTPSVKRAALGDISNKKSINLQHSHNSKQRTGHLSTKKKKNLSTATKQVKSAKFNVLPTRISTNTFNNTPSLKQSMKQTVKTPAKRPLESIEIRATRPFSPLDEYDCDANNDLLNLSIYDSDDDDDESAPFRSLKCKMEAPTNSIDDITWMMKTASLLVDDYLVDNASFPVNGRTEDEIDLSLKENDNDVFESRMNISF